MSASVWIYRPVQTSDRPLDPEKCACSVRAVAWRSTQCRNPGIHKREHNGKSYGFCGQHDPVRLKKVENAKTEAISKRFTEANRLYALQQKKQAAIGKLLALVVEADTAPTEVPGLTAIKTKAWAEILDTAKKAIRPE